MIRINISEEKIQEIEKLHWDWFKKEKLKNWIDKINKTKSFQDIFFDNNGFAQWFDKEPKESTLKWFKKQSEQKFDVFKEFIIGKNILNKCKVLTNKEFSYFINQYEEFRTYKIDEWNGTTLLNMIGLKVCPYCNRSYLTIIDNNGSLEATAQLDHFYSKKDYPYLALNLYNLIPSCGVCNYIKFDNEKELIYPYKEKFGENAKFTIDFSNKELDEKYDLNVLLGLSDNLCIDFNINKDSDNKIKNSIETFKLDKIYSTNHRDYVKDLIRKAIIYNESRIDELYNQYASLFSSKDEVWIMVLGNYINPDDLGKRPLAKLTKDIMDELGIK